MNKYDASIREWLNRLVKYCHGDWNDTFWLIRNEIECLDIDRDALLSCWHDEMRQMGQARSRMSAQITVQVVEPPASAYTLAGNYRDWVSTNRRALARRWMADLEEGTDEYADAENAYEAHMSGKTSEFTYYAESQFDLFIAEIEGDDPQETWDEAVGPVEFWGAKF